MIRPVVGSTVYLNKLLAKIFELKKESKYKIIIIIIIIQTPHIMIR